MMRIDDRRLVAKGVVTMERRMGTEHTAHAGTPAPGSDAWSREAGRVRNLAARGAVALDEDELVLLDIHDLKALSARLCTARDRPRGRDAGAVARLTTRLMGRPGGAWRHPA